MKTPLIIGAIALFLFCSCSKHPDDKSFLVQQMDKNGLHYALYYVPQSQQAKRLAQHDPQLDYQEALTRTHGHQYFNLLIRRRNGKSLSEKISHQYGTQASNVWNELRFHLQEDFQLARSNSISQCVLYHLETHPIAAKGIQLLLVFQDRPGQSTDKFATDINLQFKDRWLSQESLVFKLDQKDLNTLIAQKQ